MKILLSLNTNKACGPDGVTGIGKQWMEIPSFYLENLGGPFIFDCDYDLRLPNLSNMPAFLISIFSKRGLKFRGYVMLISTKIILEVVSVVE